VQQLRDGRDDFFVTFLRVLAPGDVQGRGRIEVEPGVTSGDFLDGFLLGTREALYENGRDSMTITLSAVNARSIGALIAVYERAVGLYATLIDVNAYHQPGVEAGKKAAVRVIELQGRVLNALTAAKGEEFDAEQVAAKVGATNEVETVQLLLQRLSADPARHVGVSGGSPEAIGGTHPGAKFRSM
jgi:glucose-6-phosphate isomerase